MRVIHGMLLGVSMALPGTIVGQSIDPAQLVGTWAWRAADSSASVVGNGKPTGETQIVEITQKLALNADSTFSSLYMVFGASTPSERGRWAVTGDSLILTSSPNRGAPEKRKTFHVAKVQTDSLHLKTTHPSGDMWQRFARVPSPKP